ncbi:SAM-dependent methyltransferase [Mycobacterium sp.]|uniref:class I SAM-dependent DNA methyltransferase n=1 Tax=Mycobacterium sp. TaxID=1785 RepID=UPI0033417700
MTERLPDRYFDELYARSRDPWRLADRWYEKRKYAITLAMLPQPVYRHALELGCSVGVLTEALTARCDHVTATDIARAALCETDARLRAAGRRQHVTLQRTSIDCAWPADDFDLVVLSEVAYYLSENTLRRVMDSEVSKLLPGTTVLAAHWRHPVSGYPLDGDRTNDIIGSTPTLHQTAHYRDGDVVIDVFENATPTSVAVRTGVPGARP